MENLLKKSLNIREKCFEISSCPSWLSTILPTRIKSVELIVDNVHEQTKIEIDLSPYQFNSSIPKLNEQDLNLDSSSIEYPNDLSHQNQFLNHSSQYLYSPSNKQLFHLFNKFKQFPLVNEKNIVLQENFHRCEEENCVKKRIPLTNFCLSHLFIHDSSQILFVQCRDDENELSVREDKKNILKNICFSR